MNSGTQKYAFHKEHVCELKRPTGTVDTQETEALATADTEVHPVHSNFPVAAAAHAFRKVEHFGQVFNDEDVIVEHTCEIAARHIDQVARLCKDALPLATDVFILVGRLACR